MYISLSIPIYISSCIPLYVYIISGGGYMCIYIICIYVYIIYISSCIPTYIYIITGGGGVIGHECILSWVSRAASSDASQSSFWVLIVCCSVLECVGVCCSVLQCAAVCCRVCVAVCCSVLQCVAVPFDCILS